MAELDLGIQGLSEYKEIGSGGFATVYSAFEADAGRTVAVKVLSSVDERGRRRFDRERRTMGQTTAHDNIVTMFRSGYTDPGNRPYLVMEHMSGGSLQDRLEAMGPLSTREAVELIMPVARGLGFAHTTGILHKDIKPGNILISATGAPKLSDFGIAAVRDATGTSQVAFSLAYTAPETFDSTRSVDGEVIDPRDERSDLYSLAVTLYALIGGAPPLYRIEPGGAYPPNSDRATTANPTHRPRCVLRHRSSQESRRAVSNGGSFYPGACQRYDTHGSRRSEIDRRQRHNCRSICSTADLRKQRPR